MTRNHRSTTIVSFLQWQTGARFVGEIHLEDSEIDSLEVVQQLGMDGCEAADRTGNVSTIEAHMFETSEKTL